MPNEPYDTLNSRFKSVCKVLLREEIGDLEKFTPWLKKDLSPIFSKPSSISKNPVAFSTDNYCSSSKRASLSEQSSIPKFTPLNLNQIKDIDSILQAISENIHYCGDMILGNCKYVEGSTNINDSFYILDCAWTGESKYMAYCTRARHSEDCFGTYMAGEASCGIKDHGAFRNKRCFETWQCRNSSDCYYSQNLESCSDCIFCFGLVSKHFHIGNLKLEKSKYTEIKERLLSQIADELKRKKQVPSLMEITAKSEFVKPSLQVPKEEEQADAQKIANRANTDFSKTFKIILKKEPTEIVDDYADWLTSKFPNVKKSKSVVSQKPLQVIQFANTEKLPLDRMLTTQEAKVFGESIHLSEDEVESINFADMHKIIGKIAFFSPEWQEGTNINLLNVPVSFSCSNLYNTHAGLVRSKDSAFGYWARDCSSIFGSSTLFTCNFCIQCHHSIKLARCFECDSCENCSDCYFCHNLENSTECMFCFNTKSLRYAIANKEYPKEEYLKIKKLVLDELNSRLEKSKKLEMSIFNIGCYKK